MNEPITLAQMWQVMLALCAATVTISAAVGVIVKIVNKAKQPERTQNARIEKLELSIKDINARLEKGDRHFDVDTERMNKLEQSMKDTNKVIISSLHALTAHALDSTKTQDLINAERDLNDYLVEKLCERR